MIQERLALIQRDLRAPKGQFNAFGKYKYRSCEDILEAVKPLLGEATLTITDEIVLIGDRYYVKATVTLRMGEESILGVAYAREEADKKGMDAAQITGACSSYARKYALNGLLLIDDTKDADTMDNTKDSKKEPPKPKETPPAKDIPLPEMATLEQVKKIQIMLKEQGETDRAVILTTLSAFVNRVLASSKELTKAEASAWIKANETKGE